MTQPEVSQQGSRERRTDLHRLGERPNRMLLVEDSKLVPLKTQPSLSAYLKQIYFYRDYVWAEARSKSNRNGEGTFLGRAWIVLDPLLQTALYALVFGVILHTSRGMDNFVGFLVLGVTFFQVSTRGFSSGSMLIQKSRSMVASFHFPVGVVPISVGISNFLNGLIPVSVGVVVALLTQPRIAIPLSLVGIIPLYIMVNLFGLGCIFLGARVTSVIPDFKSVISLGTRALFFISGVFFTISRFDGHETIQLLVTLNPVYQFLNAARTCVLEGKFPTWEIWGYMGLWAIMLSLIGFVVFWKGENKYAFVK